MELHNQPWSAEDKQHLITHYPTQGVSIAGALKRSEKAVKRKAQYMGIPGPNDHCRTITEGHGDAWSAQEDSVLVSDYPDGGVKAVRKRLPHRTAMAIRGRVELLGIKCNRNMGGRPSTRGKGSKARAYLAEHLNADNVEQCAEALGMEPSHVFRIGLIEGQIQPPKRPFSDAETEILLEQYGQTPISQLAYEMNRSIRSIESKVKSLRDRSELPPTATKH